MKLAQPSPGKDQVGLKDLIGASGFVIGIAT